MRNGPSAAEPAGPGRRRYVRLIGRTAAIGAVLLGAALLGAFVYAAMTLPDPARLDLGNQAVSIQDRHGALIEQRSAEGARVMPVSLDAVSPFLKNAIVAVEDRHFYEHHGVDWGRVIKAFFVDVVAHRPEQGASTITQQLAKVTILRSGQKTPLRKLRELILATQLEARYSKDQILEIYLNSIYYGHRATGIEAASQVYFGKPAHDLSLAEASMLAGLPKGPSLYDPKLHPQRATDRQRQVLDAMVRARMIAETDARQAEGQQLAFSFREQRSSQAAHFVDFVLEELESRLGAQAVARGGLTVRTSLDLRLQSAAQRAVERGLQPLRSRGANNGALIALDPRSGEILAMVGSVDFFDDAIKGQFNLVTGLRQPGSSFKPYVYETALRQRRISLSSVVDDTARAYRNGQFHDFDHRDLGPVTAHTALLLSRNIPTMRVMDMAGYDSVIGLARDFGITSTLRPEVTTAIGSSDISLLDNAVGYGVFASGGVRHAPVAISEVRDRSGHSLDQARLDQTARRVVSPAEAYLITHVLKDYSAEWGLGWNRPMAGKSGTTDNFRDAWMMAYSPNIVVGAWVGHTGAGNPSMNGVFGSEVGRTLLRDFINNGLGEAGIPAVNFQRPAGLVEGPGCDSESRPASQGVELFLPGTERLGCPTPTPSPSPSPCASPSPSGIPTIALSPAPGPCPSPTPSASPTPTPTPRPTPTPIPLPTVPPPSP